MFFINNISEFISQVKENTLHLYYEQKSVNVNHFIIQLMHNVKYVELIKTY